MLPLAMHRAGQHDEAGANARSAAASVACMLVMRAAMGPAATSSSRSVATRPGLTSVPPELTRGLPDAARLVANVSMALASVYVAASLTLGTTTASR